MDHNIAIVCGTLAAAPELRVFTNGTTLVRYLVTTRSEEPRRRIDVVPVVLWDPDDDAKRYERGDRIWIAASVQRRFWSDDRGARSRIEIVAHHVVQRDIDDDAPWGPEMVAMVEETTQV
ncbi:MAG: single-stranded DNA-binding protein [Actinomycetota bacterium]